MNLLEASVRLSKAALGKTLEVRGHVPPDLSSMVGEVFDIEETADAVILHVASASLAYVAPATDYQPDRDRCVKIIRAGGSSVRCVLPVCHDGACLPELSIR